MCIDVIDLCQTDKGTYQRVGEATELALRVLTEKIGLLGYGSQALDSLSRTERVTYCNDHWQHDYRKVCELFLCSPAVLADQSQRSALHGADTCNSGLQERKCQSDGMLLFLYCNVRPGDAQSCSCSTRK